MRQTRNGVLKVLLLKEIVGATRALAAYSKPKVVEISRAQRVSELLGPDV